MKISKKIKYAPKYFPKRFFVFLFLIIVFLVVYNIENISKNVLNLFTGNNNASAKTLKTFITNDDLLKPNLKDFFLDKKEENIQVQELSKDGLVSVKNGPLRNSTEKEKITDGTISLYEVKQGDTLDTIAKLFGINKNTIIWANNIKNKNIKVGDSLLIFPMNGIEYIVKNSGTLSDIAKKYNADAKEIAEYNGISLDIELKKGDILFIPDAEIEEPKITTKNGDKITKTPVPKFKNNTKSGYFMLPVSSCKKSQSLHGPYTSAIDISCPIGTTVVAAAGGTVIRATSGGYNGGYGSVIIISHPNGTQTIYAHLSKVDVNVGQKVEQGQFIGRTGNTGKSTGPHLHFETRGTSNPF